ncbi:hypothetical protein LPJ54_006960, partial [Coemansia sp. RSA 1824]
MRASIITTLAINAFVFCAGAAPAGAGISASPGTSSAIVGDVDADQFNGNSCGLTLPINKGATEWYAAIHEDIFEAAGGNRAVCKKMCVRIKGATPITAIVVGKCEGCGPNGVFLQPEAVEAITGNEGATFIDDAT